LSLRLQFKTARQALGHEGFSLLRGNVKHQSFELVRNRRLDGGIDEVPGAAELLNLQTDFDGESHAHARYLAFAVQADKEVKGEFGSPYRAAAGAEQIHLTVTLTSQHRY
jgi:hypothetical protein